MAAAAVRIQWTPLAVSHLRAAFEYLVAENPGAATKIIQRILSATEVLSQRPNIGRVGRVEGTRELVITKTPYIVAYRVRGGHVEILAVLHMARRWPEAFESS